MNAMLVLFAIALATAHGTENVPEPITIDIGPSTTNTKTIDIALPEPCYRISPKPENDQERLWTDTFSVTYEHGKLTIQRLDKVVGWTQDLVLTARCHNHHGVPCSSYRVLSSYISAEKKPKEESRLLQVRFDHLPSEKEMIETCKDKVFGLALCRNFYIPAEGEVCGTRTIDARVHLIGVGHRGRGTVVYVNCDVRAHCF